MGVSVLDTIGNTGMGSALVCGVKGYKLLLAMSEAVSDQSDQKRNDEK